jgi:hypothetical protein
MILKYYISVCNYFVIQGDEGKAWKEKCMETI